jgi:hypothetical protein
VTLGFAIDERWENNGTLLGVRLSISTTPGHVDEIAKRA